MLNIQYLNEYEFRNINLQYTCDGEVTVCNVIYLDEKHHECL